MQELLKEKKKVLFIGLPCQVGALKTVIKENDNLYTVDLICHGTPSPKLLCDYLALHNENLEEVSSIYLHSCVGWIIQIIAMNANMQESIEEVTSQLVIHGEAT